MMRVYFIVYKCYCSTCHNEYTYSQRYWEFHFRPCRHFRIWLRQETDAEICMSFPIIHENYGHIITQKPSTQHCCANLQQRKHDRQATARIVTGKPGRTDMLAETIPHTSQYALVTGASRGIGRAIAESLAREGYHLYLTCRKSSDQLSALSEALAAQYDISCIPFTADMGNPSDVEKLSAQIPALDVLVNNAGISYIGLLHEMSVADWQEVMHTNLDAVFYTSRLAIPLMLQKHSGKIINISSVWGNVGASMEAAYSASKGGVNSFTRALARELAPSGIQVNAIACGVIDTDMNKCFSKEDIEILRQEIPADRIGQASEVAQMVVSLLKAPDYLTGQVIGLDGGWM